MRLYKHALIPFLIIPFLLIFGVTSANSQNTDNEIKILKEEIKRLYERVEKLEKQRAEEKEKIAEQELREQVRTEEQFTSFGSYIDERIQKFGLFNSSNTFFSGYGAVGFSDSDGDPSTFNAVFAPIFHYQLIDRLHVLIEPEFEVEGDDVEIDLEIGQIDLFVNDYITLSGGKMLLPFNVFSERLHPTWINKLPGVPIIYGHGGHGQHDEPTQGIVPILSDVGIQIRGGLPLNIAEGSKLNYAFYLVNGPRIEQEEPDEHADEDNGDEHGDEEAESVLANEGEEHEENGEHGETELIFGNNFTDINSNKAFGGRIGFLPIWFWEIGASLMFGDAEENVDFFMYGFDTEFQYKGLLILGEFLHLENDNLGGGDVKKTGFYVQGSYRLSGIPIQNRYMASFINGLEPVLRYGKNFLPGEDQEQLAIGLDWWLLPSVPFKIAYEFNDGLPDRLLLQWAFGF